MPYACSCEFLAPAALRLVLQVSVFVASSKFLEPVRVTPCLTPTIPNTKISLELLLVVPGMEKRIDVKGRQVATNDRA